MKKLSLYLFLVLMWCNVGVADVLGVNDKKVDLNFDCKILLLPNSDINIEQVPESLRSKFYGFKEYHHQSEEELVLIGLSRQKNSDIYGLPDSEVWKKIAKKSDKKHKAFFIWFEFGSGNIFRNNLYQYRDGDIEFVLKHTLFKVDSKTNTTFENKWDKILTSTDADTFVRGLSELTADYYRYVKNKKKEDIQSESFYKCKILN